MPHSGRLGFELFDKPNWAGSDFSEKVNYQRALEAELERTLGRLSEVEAVRVHLVMPAESLYSERDRSAKASVMVKLRRGSLPQQEDMAIRQLVAGAVDRLSPDNVVVVDAETNLPLNRLPAAPVRAALPKSIRSWPSGWSRRWSRWSESHGVRASVHVEYDLSSGEETQETYDPAQRGRAQHDPQRRDIWAAARQGGVPGHQQQSAQCQGSAVRQVREPEPELQNRERHLWREQAGAPHHSAGRADQAHCCGPAGGRCRRS